METKMQPDVVFQVGDKAVYPAQGVAEISIEEKKMQPDVVFQVGDKAVYPAQGVAEIISIEEKDIAGSRQRFYVMQVVNTNLKIMVPVSNSAAVGLRPVVSEAEVCEIFEVFREHASTFDSQTWNRRYRGFVDKIRAGSIFDLAEVLRDLSRVRMGRQLSFGEKRIFERASLLIIREIATARGQTDEQVKIEIETVFSANDERTSADRPPRPRQQHLGWGAT
jgi:CarD family transcriptional regulator